MDTRLRVLLGTVFPVIGLLMVALVGCGRSASPSATISTQSPVPTPLSTTPTSYIPSPTTTPLEPLPSTITLTIWGPEQFAPSETDLATQLIRAQYEAFVRENPDVGFDYVPKLPYGEGGVLSFLLGAGYAAPDTLPDMAIVDAFELGPLARAGLAHPLQELIAEELRRDLFPFAEEACTIDGNLVGLQFEADIEHLIYYTGTLEAPPITWADLFTGPVSYIFPAAGEAGLVNDAFLIQYLAQGAQLIDEEGSPHLDDSAVRQVLRLYKSGASYDVIPSRVLELGSLEDCWEAYAEGNVTVSHISSWRYLTSRAYLQDTTFASLPTETGDVATMSRGWAFVITTADPQRQAAAVRLIEWLVSPEYLAAWSSASNHLPARASALRLIVWPDDYKDFLATQLENAFFRPSAPGFDGVASALQEAVQDVLSCESAPREATLEVMDSLE